jgi:hypothetical protein
VKLGNWVSKLFKKKELDDLRTDRIPVLFTAKEGAKVRNKAMIRNLPVSEFMRRSALGRRADVRMETQAVLALHHFIQELRALNKNLEAGGGNPSKAEMLELIRESGSTLKLFIK